MEGIRLNLLREWWKNRERYQKVLIILIILDSLTLVVTFFLSKLIFFIILFLNIVSLVYIIPSLYLIRLINQPLGPKEYYLKFIKEHYAQVDDNLLTKMFEIRITNQRYLLFSFLALFVTVTSTIAFNQAAYEYFDRYPIFNISNAKILIALSLLEVLVLVYYTVGFDRLTLTELETLFKAKEKLNQLKKEGGTEPKQPQEPTNIPTQTQENMPSKSVNIAQIEYIKAGLDFLKLLTSATLAGMFLIVVYNLQTSGANLTNVNFSLAILGFVLIVEFAVYVGVMLKLKDLP